MKNNNFISIGKIVNFHGVKGEAKLGYSKNREEFLAQLDIVYIKKDNEYKEFEIENLRFTPKYAIIKLKGIDSLNEIINFKGDVVFIKEEIAREYLEEDESNLENVERIKKYLSVNGAAQ